MSFGLRPWAVKELRTIDVPMCPGITTEALRCGALTLKSVINPSVNPFTANLAALYAVCGVLGPSDAQKPFRLLVLMTWPSSLLSRSGMNARHPLYTPPQHTANVFSHSWRGSATKLPPPPIPALLNKRLIWSVSWTHPDSGGERQHLLLVGDVRDERGHPRARRALGQRERLRLVHVVHRHIAHGYVTALGGQLPDELTAHARSPSGDHPDLARKAFHYASFPRLDDCSRPIPDGSQTGAEPHGICDNWTRIQPNARTSATASGADDISGAREAGRKTVGTPLQRTAHRRIVGGCGALTDGEASAASPARLVTPVLA